MILLLKPVAWVALAQMSPGCGPSVAPRMPNVPAKTLPPAVSRNVEPESSKTRGFVPIPTLVPSVPLVRVPSGDELAQVNQSLLKLQNAQRTQNQKPPLALDPQLTQAARVQATFCADHHELTHMGDQNSSVGDRVTAQGYRWSAVAENAAMQTPAPQGWSGPDPRTAERAVQGWMESPGHRANLLGAYTQCGACYADAPDGTRYWVVTFGVPQKPRQAKGATP